MFIGTLEIKIHINFSHSLKEKRMVKRSIIQRVKNKFNVSIAEVEDMDKHQLLVLGVSSVSNSKNKASEIIQNVYNFIELNVEGEIIDSFIEIL
ncbi:MAG: DUF503 domain-containing protein [Clostridiaceae bacterium]